MSAKRKSLKSDLKRLKAMKDKDIDYSDIPELNDSFFEKEVVTLPHKKDLISIRIDHDVLEFYKSVGRGYQSLINAVLKTYAKAHKRDNKR